MEMKLKPFLVGVTLGVMIPFIPYLFSKQGKKCMEKMKSNMVKMKDSCLDVVSSASKKACSNMDGALESINSKLDTIIKEKKDGSKVKTKSKSE